MKALRRLGVYLGLAIAIAIGQHAALAHGLSHAAEKAAQKQQGKPVPAACDLCGVCTQLTGLGASVPSLPAVAAALVPAHDAAFHSVPAAAPVVFLSRAPPVLS